jgi:hypothetical protein
VCQSQSNPVQESATPWLQCKVAHRTQTMDDRLQRSSLIPPLSLRTVSKVNRVIVCWRHGTPPPSLAHERRATVPLWCCCFHPPDCRHWCGSWHSGSQTPHRDHGHLYKERQLVEWFIHKRKCFRRSFSRFDKLATRSLRFLSFVAMLIWLRYTVNRTLYRNRYLFPCLPHSPSRPCTNKRLINASSGPCCSKPLSL